jgi:xanthine dehydrogenase accessory factor
MGGSQGGSGARQDAAGETITFYGRLAALLAGSERLALCTILRLAGSGPRSAGAKMLVREAGASVGSIGGGVLEVKATTWAREVLRTGRAMCRPFALDLQQASEEGMTCGGEVEVLVEPLEGARPAVRDFFGRILAVGSAGERAWLATAIREEGDGVATARVLVVGGRAAASLPPAGLEVPEDLLKTSTPPAPVLIERGVLRYFLEPLTRPITVFVFGGGHIAMHLVPLCDRLGFRTVVVEDRADFASRDRFPQASELVVPASLEHALDGLPLGDESFVIIVTRGHAGDQAILRQALRRRPGYIGMIGSRRKRQLIFDQLAGEGFTPEDLAQVVCPIGLPIGAETPEEIAVSIAAQLIATRAARHTEG